MKKYDVIICGAGPAGTVAATFLVKNGYSVLVVEKNKFPRDKVCGDCFAPSGIKILQELDLIDENYLKAKTIISKISAFAKNEASINIKIQSITDNINSYVLPRYEIDGLLFDKSQSFGTVVHYGKLIEINYSSDLIIINTKNKNGEQKFACNFLIGADGVSSTVARLSGLKPCKNRSIAIRGYLDGLDIDEHGLQIFYNENVIPGYGWLFPLSKTQANVGLGLSIKDYTNNENTMKEMLLDFVNNNLKCFQTTDDIEIKDIKTWPLNMGNPRWSNLSKQNTFLLGDAASLINPASGGGISSAIISGKIIGEVLADGLKNKEDFHKIRKNYIKKIKKTFKSEFNKSKFVADFISLFPNSVSWIINFANKNNWLFKFINNIYKDIDITKIENK